MQTQTAREIKAKEIAERYDRWEPVTLPSGTQAFQIPSQSGDGAHTTSIHACSCADARFNKCKHRLALELVLERLERTPGKFIAGPSRFAAMSEAELFGRL